MTLFYQKTLYNQELAPFFVVELGDDINSKDWIEHIELLADFWLAHLLNEKTYGGNFVGAHVNVPYIKKENFVTWMRLFSVSLDEVYVSKIAQNFKKQGIILAEKFIKELNL